MRSLTRDDCGDTIDVHAYPGPWPKPRHRNRWYGEGWWAALHWTHAEARASVLGEFGGVSHRVVGHTWSGESWGYETSDGCDDLVSTMEALWRKAADSGLSAAVYTQLSDVETEVNGVLTYDRVLKCEGLVRAKLPPVLRLFTRRDASEPRGEAEGLAAASHASSRAHAEGPL